MLIIYFCLAWANWELVVVAVVDVEVVQEHERLLGLVEEIHCVEIAEILQCKGIEGRDRIIGLVERILLELIEPCVVEKGSLFVEV